MIELFILVGLPCLYAVGRVIYREIYRRAYSRGWEDSKRFRR